MLFRSHQSWKSIKQSCIANSTIEVEYVVASEAAKEAVWLQKFVQDLEVVPSAKDPIIMYYDNSGAVAQAKEPRNNKSQKHIERKYHIIRDIVQCGEIKVMKIVTTDNVADLFTKAITGKAFNQHLEFMGMKEMPQLLES